MKRILLTAIVVLEAFAANAQQEWLDVTEKYVKNPTYANNNYSFWEGTPLSGYNPVENAEHFNKTYDTYQAITGLKAGKYRVRLKGFYRMGTASEDYALYKSGNYSANQYAKLYATSSIDDYSVAIVPASAGIQKYGLGGSTAGVGNKTENWWGGTSYQFYIPDNMEAAYYWFNAGYYNNTLSFEVGEDGKLKIGIRKSEKVNNDWTCIDDWKLEYWGEPIKVKEITLSPSEIKLIPLETAHISYTLAPEDVTYPSVTWSSSNTNVATVDKDGNVTAISVGTATIYATAVDKGGAHTSCTVTVEAPAKASSENIKINEIMAANVDVYRDPSTNFGSWVELYNPTDKGIALGGLYVTDDANNLKKHRLVDNYGPLSAHSFAVLNFDHFEVFTKESYRQIDDKLDCDGGTIIISDGENILAEATYPEAISRVSYALTKDGGSEWGTTDAPTPGASNSTSVFNTKQLKKPEVDTPAKLFTGSLNVTVTIPEGATLRYTTDGTTPTLTNGKTSTNGKFYVSNSGCYRFRLFQDGMLASPVVTRTYIKNNNNEPFPIISIVTDMDNLFGAEVGMFEYSNYGRPGNGQDDKYNGNMDWDRPVNFEYITTKNECVISQECDLSACGGWSRAWSPHSFKLKAGKAYDLNNTFAYQFFGTEKDNPAVENGKSYLKHKTLQIRNGGNDNSCRIKDAAMQQIVASSGLYLEHQAWQPVHVYINGASYAVLNMREPNNKHHAYANYGIDTDLMDQFEICADSGYVQKAGTKDSFNKWYELAKTASSEDSYNEICKLVDIDEYINYMATEFYLGSDDWPHNNVKAYRDQNDGKFRFVLFDVDFAQNRNKPFDDFFKEQNFNFNELKGFDYSKNKNINGTRLYKEIEVVTIFKNMLNNETFRKKFIDAYCVIAGSVFEPNRAKKIINDMADYLSTGGYVDPTWSVNELINGLSSRQSNMITQLKNCSYMNLGSKLAQSVTLASNIEGASILINGMEVPTGKFSGKLFAPITLKAAAPAGYRFVGWKSSDGKSVSGKMEYEMPSTGTINLTAVWEKAENDKLPDFADAPIKINEVSAGNDMLVNELFKKDDWVELYNTTDYDLNVNGLYISDNEKKPEKYQIAAPTEEAAIIPAHGHLIVWCSKRDAKSQIHANFKLENKGEALVLISSSDEFVANNSAYFDANPQMKEFADTMHYSPMAYDQTVGRFPDGGNNYYLFRHPTIAYANSIQPSDVFVGMDIISGEIETGIIEVAANNQRTTTTAYYTLNGVFVGKSLNSLPRGIYIEVSGAGSRKVMK